MKVKFIENWTYVLCTLQFVGVLHHADTYRSISKYCLQIAGIISCILAKVSIHVCKTSRISMSLLYFEF